MADSDDAFLQRLQAMFRVEAQEHIDALFNGLEALEKPGEHRATRIEALFREAHSLKGAARSVDQAQIEAACQALEDRLSRLKRQEAELSPSLLDSLRQACRQLQVLLESSNTAGDAPPLRPQPTAATGEAPPSRPPSPQRPAQKSRTSPTVRIAAERLDNIFLQVEEMLAAKLVTQQHKRDLEEIRRLALAWSKEWRGFKSQYREAYSAVATDPYWGELLERNTVFARALEQQLGAMVWMADQEQRQIGRMVDELLENMKQLLMLPFSTVLEIFPRLVRDLAEDHGKEIELVMQGTELEADRRILEAIKDPLVHLVRNCVDHGIEPPEMRELSHKPRRGRIVIAIAPRDGNRVEITVSDDGGGIDTSKVRSIAERLGLFSAEKLREMSDEETLDLIYHSGITTSPTVTEISGRGLGLAIVREKVDILGGSVTTVTHSGIGTSFRILLPLTLTTYRGVVVRVDAHVCVLPTIHVEQTLRIAPSAIGTAESLETVRIGGEALALVWLHDVLEIPRVPLAEHALLHVAVLSLSGRRLAFVVDEILHEQEVLVKSLGPQLRRVRNVAAATILGSGQAVPILDVADLMKSALLSPRPRALSGLEREDVAQPKSVLVVEDSITSRNLLKGILEMAGYRVATAVDGADAYRQLRNRHFDLVVSDVEMPRMNGFELTQRIRSDERWADLPVILVTALESREDRERGIEVGANAYIVKRSFEQSNLLETVGRLI